MKDEAQQIGARLRLMTLCPTDWAALAAVLSIAAALRLLLYTGFFGSDEVTYVQTAVNIASGDWRASNYIGATRYGMNLPVALAIYIFGLSEASANLWPFLCSVGEVAIVFVVARWLWNTRTAVICASLLALLPLHVEFAGRMMADPPLAFFLTLSSALMLRAAYSRRWFLYVGAGLAWGGVFWVKESVALLYAPVFLFLTVYLCRINRQWFLLIGGMFLAMAANSALMYVVAGDPMHVFVVMKRAVANISGMTSLSEYPWFYLHYLFFDIKHTFLIGYLAAAGILLLSKRFVGIRNNEPSAKFVALWALLLIGMFSLAVVSFSPVKLVMKQTNYMLIFVAPLALLAGWFLASIPRRIFVPLGALIVTGSLVLAALEQQTISVFTANSRAAHIFLREHPNAFLLGSTNNERAIYFYSLMENQPEMRSRVMSLGEMSAIELTSNPVNMDTRTSGKDVFALLDLQNNDWGNKPGEIRRLSDVPKCWTPMGTLPPAALGNGRFVANALLATGQWLPTSLRQRYLAVLEPILVPAKAYLFSVNSSCSTNPTR